MVSAVTGLSVLKAPCGCLGAGAGTGMGGFLESWGKVREEVLGPVAPAAGGLWTVTADLRFVVTEGVSCWRPSHQATSSGACPRQAHTPPLGSLPGGWSQAPRQRRGDVVRARFLQGEGVPENPERQTGIGDAAGDVGVGKAPWAWAQHCEDLAFVGDTLGPFSNTQKYLNGL